MIDLAEISFLSLFSFAKYLELLIYSPALCKLTPTLCEHTTSPAGADSLPSSRFNIIRHFSTVSGDVSFALSKIQAIFELRVPRLQITRGLEKFSPVTNTSKKEDANMDGAHKKALRREIRKWWEGISDHIDKIVRDVFRPPTLVCSRFWLIYCL